MGITYFKRFRMEFDLRKDLFAVPELPTGYLLLHWSDSLLAAHSDVKFRSFRFEIDANVFPCLGDSEGCHRLMREISGRQGFLGGATWLLGYQPPGQRRFEYCGTVQGIADRRGFGSIQNLGVTPEHRQKGLGSILLRKALEGFIEAGLQHSCLEVTAQNTGALRLYNRLGFRTVKTVYKAVEMAYA